MLPKLAHLVLAFLIDEGVPDEVGRVIEARGHTVTYGNKSLPRGSADQLVCAAAMNAGLILVAADHDIKAIAKAQGIGNERFKSLHLVKLSCRKPEAAEKIRHAMSLIEHEWQHNAVTNGQRMWVEIGPAVIRVVRQELGIKSTKL